MPSLTCSSLYGMRAALTDIHYVCCCAPTLFRQWPAVSFGCWRADPFLTYEEVRERGRSLLAETAPRVAPFLSRRSMLRGNDAGQPSARESLYTVYLDISYPIFSIFETCCMEVPLSLHTSREHLLC